MDLIKRISPIFYFLLSVLWIVPLTACQPRIYHRTDYVFGTLVDISVYHHPNAEKIVSEVIEELYRLQRLLHSWQPSELYDVNKAIQEQKTPVTISPELADILIDAQRYSAQTEGLFNPAIGGLVRAWGFHQEDDIPRIPPVNLIEALLEAKPSMEDITLIDNQLTCTNKAVWIDLGGYAKGLALDRAQAILKKQGIENALINIGGNILAMGQKGKTPWTVGIQDPKTHRPFATLPLYDGEAIGTSGDYQRFFSFNGKRYHHLIDPKNGQPADKVSSVTIIVDYPHHAGIASDVLTKPLFIEGSEQLEKWSKRFHLDKVLVITKTGRLIMTDDMQERITLLTESSETPS